LKPTYLSPSKSPCRAVIHAIRCRSSKRRSTDQSRACPGSSRPGAAKQVPSPGSNTITGYSGFRFQSKINFLVFHGMLPRAQPRREAASSYLPSRPRPACIARGRSTTKYSNIYYRWLLAFLCIESLDLTEPRLACSCPSHARIIRSCWTRRYWGAATRGSANAKPSCETAKAI